MAEFSWACVSCGASKVRQHAQCRCGSAGGALRSELKPAGTSARTLTGTEAARQLAERLCTTAGPIDGATAQMVLQLRRYSALDVIEAKRGQFLDSLG